MSVKRHIAFGGGYQLINFLLLLIQAVFMPRYLGLEAYGLGLFVVLPVLLLGGIWEPIVQYFNNDHGGLPGGRWIQGVFIAVIIYGVYLYLMAHLFEVGFIVIFLGLFFAVEYLFSIYVISLCQSIGRYADLLVLSFVGFLFSGIVLLFEPKALLVCIFYIIYFLPFFIRGVLWRKKLIFCKLKGLGGGNVLDAVSTRLFYIIINNFYVLIAGLAFGPAKAALLKIVISLTSAFRFVSPLSIGHFYSLLRGAGWKKSFLISLFPLVCFSIAIAIAVFFIPVFEDFSRLLLAQNYEGVIDVFLSLAFGVPFYLWSPYLTIVFLKVLGWRAICLACFASVFMGVIGAGFWGVSLFFIVSSIFYCAVILGFGCLFQSRKRNSV